MNFSLNLVADQDFTSAAKEEKKNKQTVFTLINVVM